MQVWRANEAASFGQNEILAPISFCLMMIWLLISIFQKVYCINMQLTVYRNDFSVDLPSTPTPSSQYVSLLGVVTLTGERRRKPELRCVSPSTPVCLSVFFVGLSAGLHKNCCTGSPLDLDRESQDFWSRFR